MMTSGTGQLRFDIDIRNVVFLFSPSAIIYTLKLSFRAAAPNLYPKEACYSQASGVEVSLASSVARCLLICWVHSYLSVRLSLEPKRLCGPSHASLDNVVTSHFPWFAVWLLLETVQEVA